GYAGFGKLVDARGDGSLRLAFCWAHARRPFYEFYTSSQSPLAAEVLARIAKLYAIEADIRGQPADLRRTIRQERSRPLGEDLHRWLQDHLPRLPGWSDLAKPSGMYFVIGTGSSCISTTAGWRWVESRCGAVAVG